MPTVSRFYGITIRMNFKQKEHNPPHIHAKYGDYEIIVDFQKEVILEGVLPTKATELVMLWVSLHKDELLYMWKNQSFSSIEPLM